MKEMYCSKCGKEVCEGAVICPNCGCPTGKGYDNQNTHEVKKSAASIVLGILGIIFSWVFALVGHILSVIGIVLGYKEYNKNGSKSGLVLSIIGEVCSVISSAIGLIVYFTIM